MLGRARPIKCSSSRLIRIITGVPVFFARSAGMMSVTDPVALLPYPPPQYSLISTMFCGSRLSQRAIEFTVWIVLCVER
jgi:hypothetical protein